MRFRTVLLHPCCLALAVKGGGFHTPLMCTCQPASAGSRRAVTALSLPFDFSLLRLLFFLLSGFQLAACKGAQGWQKVTALGWVIYGGFITSQGVYWTSGRGRDVIGTDMTTLRVVSLTWNYTRVNHPHQFLPFEIVLYMWFFFF